MRIVVQRVSEASVFIAGESKASIANGLLVLLGIEHEDASEDVLWLVRKITQLRIFPDENEVMNRSVVDVNGEVLVVSQFTLHASTKKGNRPSYIKAARPEQAIPLYEHFVHTLQMSIPTQVQTGEFGADMQIKLINDGPVTIIIDSKIKE
jgi:D-tyrosyl-tRNA(Tyr) deacylase